MKKKLGIIILACLMGLSIASHGLADACDDLISQGDSAGSRVDAGFQQGDQIVAQYQSAEQSLQALSKEYVEGDPANRPSLAQRIRAEDSNLKQIIRSMIELKKNQLSDLSIMSSIGDEFVSMGCGSFDSAAVQSQIGKVQGDLDLAHTTLSEVESRDWVTYLDSIIAGNQKQQQDDSPPTVKVVNNAGMSICIHPGGTSGGSCIGPGKTSTYNLDRLYMIDDDHPGMKFKTNQLVIVGGGYWAGSPYTSYQEMSLCTQRIFKHDSGEVVWSITPVLEENCGVRGYHQ